MVNIMKKKNIILFLTILICFVIDQGMKAFITTSMSLADSIQIIRNFIRITYVQNIGAAWSIFAGNSILLIGIGILSCIFVFLFYRKYNQKNSILFGILLGGILGNLIDRIRYGYVIDYIDMNFGNYQYPIFNIADIFIVISVLILCYKMWKEEEDDHSNRRKSK